jgi:cell division protein FtsL
VFAFSHYDQAEATAMKRFPEHQHNAMIRRSRDATALSRLALLLFCGLVLAAGFVFAAKQHFAAVQYGYESENLRRERRQLLEEQQRLSLEKEKVFAPARLAPAARKLGLKPATSRQIATLETKSEVETTETRDRDKPSAALTR